MHAPYIPRYWTAQEALAVADFLQAIIDDIWDVHGDTIAPMLRPPDEATDPPLSPRPLSADDDQSF